MSKLFLKTLIVSLILGSAYCGRPSGGGRGGDGEPGRGPPGGGPADGKKNKKAWVDPRFRDPMYGNMKVKQMPVFKLTAADIGSGAAIDQYFWHIDQQTRMEDQEREERRRARYEARIAKINEQKAWRQRARQGVANGMYGAPGRYGRGLYQQRQRSLLKPGGFVESKVGEKVNIPLQTATPDIPADVMAYYEQSRKNDMALAEEIMRKENEKLRRETYFKKNKKKLLTRPMDDHEWKDVAGEGSKGGGDDVDDMNKKNEIKGEGGEEGLKNFSFIKKGDLLDEDQNDGKKKKPKNVPLAERKHKEAPKG